MLDEGKQKSAAVADRIRKRISSGEFSSGHRLPSEQELARDWGISHLTVRKGLDSLVTEGLILKRARVGNFVCDVPASVEARQIAVLMPRKFLGGGSFEPAVNVLMGGVLSSLDHDRYSVSTLPYDDNDLWRSGGRLIVRRGIQGVLLRTTSDIERRHVERLLESGVRVVLLEDRIQLRGLGLPAVSWDDSMALAQISDRLIDLGHRRVVVAEYAVPTHHRARNREVTDLFRRRLGLRSLDDLVLSVPEKRPHELDLSVLAALFDGSAPPTAVVVPDEYSASEVFRMAYERGLSVPDDLSIAALIDCTPGIHPVPLTAADGAATMARMAQHAISCLTRLLDGKDIAEREVWTQCNVIWKASLAPPRKA